MKRRGFIRALAATPAVPALIAQQSAPQTAPPATPVVPLPGGRGAGRGGGRGGAAADVPHIPLTSGNDVAEGVHRFFTAPQYATLRKLGAILVPPVKENIGALDTDAPDFLDFLISVSPADRQTLYRTGLDGLNAQARRQFNKPFADLEATQADTILKPLLTAVPWVYDLPKDPMKRFVYQAHSDLRTATRNSPEAVAALANSGRRGGAGGGLFWNVVDPV